MADSKSYLAPLGLALVGALFGIGHFGGLNKVLFGSDKEYENVSDSYTNNSYSSDYSGEIVFRGTDSNSDGYIFQGNISLERVISGKTESFYLFNKGGIDYVAKSKSGPYYRLSSRMTINGIDYQY